MVTRVNTVAFQGVDVLPVDVQVQVSNGLPSFSVVGLPDKAVSEARERVRAALHALNLSLPPKRITINLAPADLAKEGSHYDLPIALGLLGAMGIVPKEDLSGICALGELSLDGSLRAVSGILPAAMHSFGQDMVFVCPKENGSEAVWAGDVSILAPDGLLGLINHFKGTQVLSHPIPPHASNDEPDLFPDLDFADVRGQESAKRAMEIAAAGGHNVLMVGPPGAGKSMLAARLPGILPPLNPKEALEISMIYSVSGLLTGKSIVKQRPFRDPHHSASLPSLVGGGHKARPGEISLAHNGVLFLDELPEFQRATLEALRQPLETGQTLISRANAHVSYPANFQLIAAMNPCRCGHLGDPALACSRAPKCGADYQAKLSGPLLDRFDIHLDVPAVAVSDLARPKPKEGSAEIRQRVMQARNLQQKRLSHIAPDKRPRSNADLKGDLLESIASPDKDGMDLITKAAENMNLSARGFHRVLRVARTIADLEAEEKVSRKHIAEALSYRRINSMNS